MAAHSLKPKSLDEGKFGKMRVDYMNLEMYF